MDNSNQYEIRNLGISILVPFSALLITSFYVMQTSETSSYDTVVGRMVAWIVLAFFVWNCVLSFQKGRFLSPDGDPTRGAKEDIRTGPILAFVSALAVLGLVVSLSGPSQLIETWKQRLGFQDTSISAQDVAEGADMGSNQDNKQVTVDAPTPPPPAIGADGLPINQPAGASSANDDANSATEVQTQSKLTVRSFFQILLLLGMAGVLAYFSVHISGLDNKISQRDTALISHSAIYFVITFLNTLVLGSPMLLGFLSDAVPDTFFSWALGARTILLVIGVVILTIDALRVFSASYKSMLAIVQRWRLPLPVRQSGASGLFSAIGLLLFVIGRVVRIVVNVAIGVFVWLYVLSYYFIASFLRVVRATVFSWALLFALIHSLAFALLALALLQAPDALTYVRTYFATGDTAPAIAIGMAVAIALFISILLAVIAYVSVHFSWPTAFVTTIPELFAYTLIAVWLNTTVLHILKAALNVGPDIFGSVWKLGLTFWIGILFGIVAAIAQTGSPSPARVAKIRARQDLPYRTQKLSLPGDFGKR